jgi:hypothetical protein
MSSLQQTPTGRERYPGDIDGLLRRYFQAEMPQPWPVAPEPAGPAAPVSARPHLLFRSRFALAASLLLLLFGHLCLSGRFSESLPTGTEGPGKTEAGRHDPSGKLRLKSPPPPGDEHRSP